MMDPSHHIGRLAVWTLVLCTAPGFAMADYAIDWHTIDGGGTASTGGGFSLTGTIGQPDASATPMTGGELQLEGGFWPGGAMAFYTLTLLYKDAQYGRVVLDPPPSNPSNPMYAADTDVTLLAEPNEGKKFTKWKVWDADDPNITVIDKNNPITIDMVTDRKVKAFFKCGGGGVEDALPLLIVFATLALIRRRA